MSVVCVSPLCVLEKSLVWIPSAGKLRGERRGREIGEVPSENDAQQ